MLAFLLAAGDKNKKKKSIGKNSSNSTTDQGAISPMTLAALYNVPSTPYPGSKSTQAAIQFLSAGAYEPCDLTGCAKTKNISRDLGFFNLSGVSNATEPVTIVGAFVPDGGEVSPPPNGIFRDIIFSAARKGREEGRRRKKLWR